MAPRKTKSETLARVRDNQRRWRTRKREYVFDLERQLHACRVTGTRPDIETHRNIAERLMDENRKLRDLLNQAGVSRTYPEAHLRENRNTPDGRDTRGSYGLSKGMDGQAFPCIRDSSPFPGLETASSTTDRSVFCPSGGADQLQPQPAEHTRDDEGASPSPSFNDLLNEPFIHLSEDFHYLESTTQSISHVDLPSPSLAADGVGPADPRTTLTCPCTPLLLDSPETLDSWSLPPLPLIPDDLGAVKEAQTESDTTLCTVAYEMIRQHNKKAVDMIEIGFRLWNSFVKGDGDDGGCKVENKALFSVLDYVSG